MSVSVVLKVSLHNDPSQLHRVPIPNPANCSFGDLSAIFQAMFTDKLPSNFCVQYVDDEGDTIIVSNSGEKLAYRFWISSVLICSFFAGELQEAFSVTSADNSKSLRLTLVAPVAVLERGLPSYNMASCHRMVSLSTDQSVATHSGASKGFQSVLLDRAIAEGTKARVSFRVTSERDTNNGIYMGVCSGEHMQKKDRGACGEADTFMFRGRDGDKRVGGVWQRFHPDGSYMLQKDDIVTLDVDRLACTLNVTLGGRLLGTLTDTLPAAGVLYFVVDLYDQPQGVAIVAASTPVAMHTSFEGACAPEQIGHRTIGLDAMQAACRGHGGAGWDQGKSTIEFQLSEDGRTACRTAASSWKGALVGTKSMLAAESRQHYFEVKYEQSEDAHANHDKGYAMIGVCGPTMQVGSKSAHQAAHSWLYYGANGWGYHQSKCATNWRGVKFAAGDTVGVLIDFAHGSLAYFLNGQCFGTVFDNCTPGIKSLSEEAELFACVDAHTQHDRLTLLQPE
jgi:hypothetical protein